jgi:uncharacterized protein YutE (UPF0331/DUF86 family)
MNVEEDVERVAEHYRQDGYEVIVHPQQGQLPPFAADFGADLIAVKGHERVLVEVKADRGELRSEPEIARLADITHAQPGWRLDLVVLRHEQPEEKIVREASEPSVEQIRCGLEDADEMARAGEGRMSIVMAWSIFEATMRRVARASGVDLTSNSPAVMIRTLYSVGILSREEFDRLEQAIRVRNSVVHGFDLPKIDPALTEHVTSVARRLLEEAAKPSPTIS